jgi:hypothetical protein
MGTLATRLRARPQLEALEERWQPSASFGSFRREAFADFLAAFRRFADADGQQGRSTGDRSDRGHGRHEHTRSEGRGHWGGWDRGHDSDCGTRWRGNSCGHHRGCDQPDPEPPPAPPPQLGSLSGFVFVDLNSNGVPDEGETRIEGALILLSWTDANDVPHEVPVMTAADGSYLFENLTGGIEYTITEVQPFPYGDGADHLGSLGGDQGDDMFRVVLPVGARGVNYNFTEVFGE